MHWEWMQAPILDVSATKNKGAMSRTQRSTHPHILTGTKKKWVCLGVNKSVTQLKNWERHQDSPTGLVIVRDWHQVEHYDNNHIPHVQITNHKWRKSKISYGGNQKSAMAEIRNHKRRKSEITNRIRWIGRESRWKGVCGVYDPQYVYDTQYVVCVFVVSIAPLPIGALHQPPWLVRRPNLHNIRTRQALIHTV